jgi:hypothetical protein
VRLQHDERADANGLVQFGGTVVAVTAQGQHGATNVRDIRQRVAIKQHQRGVIAGRDAP